MSLLSQTLKRLNTPADIGSARSSARLSVVIAAIFLLAFTVRIFSRQDTRLEVGKVQTWVSEDYRQAARFLLRDGFASFFSRQSPLGDPNRLGHPPGYSFLLAVVYKVFGDGDAAVQFVQIVCDSAAAVVLFLIAAELLPAGVAATAGILVALSPQLSYNSVLLLPDSLAVLPILLAVYCIVRAM
ncbi:MAG TPA: glycosyltransferase family 39 protein, partial [Pyrinomonadaceae bacterium]|nr:glycosyltransferase family 39 protein [Pyrinomonadaceae bacterium]